jgi:ribulose kinase
VLDYWQGNRTPYVDPEARGIIRGLSLKHTSGHIFRAIIEGIAYGTEHILQVFRQNGYVVEEMVGAGGATNSPLWMQIHADVSNVPITTTAVAAAPTLGSAILGAVAAGLYPDVQTAADQMVHVKGRIEPNPELHRAYQFYVEQYITTYPRLQDLMQQTVRHVAGK